LRVVLARGRWGLGPPPWSACGATGVGEAPSPKRHVGCVHPRDLWGAGGGGDRSWRSWVLDAAWINAARGGAAARQKTLLPLRRPTSHADAHSPRGALGRGPLHPGRANNRPWGEASTRPHHASPRPPSTHRRPSETSPDTRRALQTMRSPMPANPHPITANPPRRSCDAIQRAVNARQRAGTPRRARPGGRRFAPSALHRTPQG
jgi:hypothetical protein